METRDEIEAGVDLTDTEIAAARVHLDRLRAITGKLAGCTSYIQRRMGIGYNHAARIMQYLEAIRYVSEPDDKGERRFR